MNMKRRLSLLACLVALCHCARAEVRYAVKDLGRYAPMDLNNHGIVALDFGERYQNPGPPAMFWDGAQFSYLPPTSIPTGYFTATVTAENDNGQLTGWVAGTVADPQNIGQVAVWANGAGQPPTLIGPRAQVGTPKMMNALGHVLLQYDIYSSPAIWSSDKGLTSLPNPPSSKYWGAEGINDSDLVVGWTETLDGIAHPVTWQGGQVHQLDTGSWPQGAAYAVANDGWIAGSVVDNSALTGNLALWSPNGALSTFDLPAGTTSIGGHLSINSAHQVVGGIAGTVSGSFLFENGTITMLADVIPADTAISMWAPVKINDKGQILVQGTILNSGLTYYRGVLLNPVSAMARALSIAGGLQAATSGDVAVLKRTGTGDVSLTDAIHLARQAAGLER